MSSTAEQKKKKISPKAQQIIDIVVTAIEALIVVVCIIVSVTAWVGLSKPQSRALNWFTIQTDSMMGSNADSLDPGDLMFAKRVKAITDLKEGDVIAYVGIVKDSKGELHENQIITHRIISIDYDADIIKTKGDNAGAPDGSDKKFADVIGKYSGKIKGIGKMILWLGGYQKVETDTGTIDADTGVKLGGYGYEQTGNTTAFLVIIIPLALLFIYNGYIVAKWVLDERAKKIRAAALAEAQAGQADSAESEAAIKRAALVEFMKAQGMTDEQIDAYFASQAPAEEQPAEAQAEQAEQIQEEAGEQSAEDKPQQE